MMDQFDLEEPWGQYITIDADIQKNDFKKYFPKYFTPSDVNTVKYTPYLNPIIEEKHNNIMDRDGIVKHHFNNPYNWEYRHFIFGNICLRVVNVFFYVNSYYESLCKND
jgi:hypothetical protein